VNETLQLVASHAHVPSQSKSATTGVDGGAIAVDGVTATV
jgi:hypothetical protein